MPTVTTASSDAQSLTTALVLVLTHRFLNLKANFKRAGESLQIRNRNLHCPCRLLGGLLPVDQLLLLVLLGIFSCEFQPLDLRPLLNDQILVTLNDGL